MSSCPSARFSTLFDRPVPTLEPPGEVISGDDPVIRAVDGFFRGAGILGRFAADPGMVALKVAAGGRPVQVDALVRADRVTAKWWHRRAPGNAGSSNSGLRLLALTSQGSLRSAALLDCRRSLSQAPVRGHLRFDLYAGEVVDEGLLMLEFGQPAVAQPAWAHPVIPHSAVGIALMRVEAVPQPATTSRRRPCWQLDAATCERWGLLSTGDLPQIDEQGERPLPTSALVVNPLPAHLQTDQPDALLIDIEARLSSRMEAVLPRLLGQAVFDGPIGRVHRRASRIAQGLKPMQVAAARELRRELNLPRLAAAVERNASNSQAQPESLVAGLHALGALQVAAVRLADGSSEPASWAVGAHGRVKLRLSAGILGPVLIQFGVDHEKAESLLAGRLLRWSVAGIESAVADRTPVALSADYAVL